MCIYLYMGMYRAVYSVAGQAVELAQLCECVSVCSTVFACFLITPVFALVCIVFK